jgi:hypothetical protein
MPTLLKLSNYDIKKKLTDFSDENFKDMSYCNHQLTSGATRRIPGESNLSAVIDKTTSELDNLVKGTSECIKARFDSFSSNDVLRAFQVTEPRGWPTRKEELINHGQSNIEILVKHYKAFLLKKGLTQRQFLMSGLNHYYPCSTRVVRNSIL